MGTILFYLLWPFVWFYAPLFVRGRGIIIVDGQVLVVKNWFGPGRWQLPGGGFKLGESPMQAIDRELREELGLQKLSGKLLVKEPVTIKSGGLLLRQMYAIYRLDSRPSITKSQELTAFEWLDITEAPIPNMIRKIL